MTDDTKPFQYIIFVGCKLKSLIFSLLGLLEVTSKTVENVFYSKETQTYTH